MTIVQSFGNWYIMIELLVRFAVLSLIRYSGLIMFCKPVFPVLRHLVGLECSVPQTLRNFENVLELAWVHTP